MHQEIFKDIFISNKTMKNKYTEVHHCNPLQLNFSFLGKQFKVKDETS